MRNAYCRELYEIMRKDERVYALTADIGYKNFDKIIEAYPSRFINVGVAEANMVGIASGLALSGKIPFIFTIAPFVTMRCLEQIRIDLCYHNLPVKIIGAGGGFVYGPQGTTHHAIEEVGVLRSLPNITIICPADPVETAKAVKASMDLEVPVYIRIGRNHEPVVTGEGSKFVLGKADVIKDGNDITIISTGFILPNVLKSATELDKEGISVRVVNMHTVKPADREMVLKCADETCGILTVEEHNIIGGLGSAVAEILAESKTNSIPFVRLGIKDSFICINAGYKELQKELGLDPDGIAGSIRSLLSGSRNESMARRKMADKYRMDGHKLWWHLDRVNDWLKDERIVPLHIDMGITTGCNMVCTYCYGVLQGRVGKGKRFDMPLDVIKRCFKDAKEVGVRSIALIGEGENTLNPHIYDALNYAKETNLDVSLATNGIILNRERAKGMLEVLAWIRFNISAATPETYFKIHRVHEFENVKNNILTCVELKKKYNMSTVIGLQMVIMRENVNDIVLLAKLGAELGVDYLVIKPCSDDPSKSLNAPTEEYLGMKKFLKEAESYSNDNYNVTVKWQKVTNLGLKDFKVCYGTRFIIGISGDGSVFPCGHFFNIRREEFKMGNIFETSFSAIVRSERYWEVQRKIEEVNVNKECETNCRQYYASHFLWTLKNKPPHVNFI